MTDEAAETERHLFSMSFDIRTGIIVAVLSLLPIIMLHQVSVSVELLFAMQFEPLLNEVIPLLLAFPVPAAFIASISKERFRWECLGTAAAFIFAGQGQEFMAAAAGMVLGGVFVSYKAKSIFNGHNTGWTFFKATGSMLTILALAIAFSTSSFYMDTPAFRTDIQRALTDQTVDIAVEHANLAELANTGGNTDALEAMQTGLAADLIGTLAENLSRTTVQATEVVVFSEVEQSGEFDAQELAVLDDAFTRADEQIPAAVSTQAEEWLSEDIGATSVGDTGQSAEDESIKQLITPQVRTFVNDIVSASPETQAIVFVATFSLIMLFKIPFELIGALYASLLSWIRRRTTA